MEILAALGPLLLTGMGLAITLAPKLRRFRWISVGLFVVVGATTTYATVHVSRSTGAMLEKTHVAVTEEDRFVYLKADLSNVQSAADMIPLVLVNDNDNPAHDITFWISPASAELNPSNPAYWSADRKTRITNETYTQGLTDIQRAVPLGHYLIEINARSRLFLQSLKIESYEGNLVQTVELYDRKSNELIYSYP